MDFRPRSSSRRVPPVDTLNIRTSSSAAVVSSRNSLPSFVAEQPSSERRPRSRRPSFKRAISIISEPGSRQTGSAAAVAPAFGSPAPRKSWAHPKRSTAKPTTRPVPEPEPPLQYYQDPETRLRLKEYLGSPQRFEDALKHGFPTARPDALAKDSRVGSLDLTPRLSIARSRTSNNDAPRFLRNDVISWLDNDEGNYDDDDDDDRGNTNSEQDTDNDGRHDCSSFVADPHTLGEFDIDDYLDDPAERSSPELMSPVTPHAHDFTPIIRPKSARRTPHALPLASLSSDVHHSLQKPGERASASYCYDRPSDYSTPTSPTSPLWPGARDMTLRMTLTRPELRASDEQIYGALRARTETSRPLLRGGSDPWDLPPLDESVELGEEPGAQRTRSRSIWKKMSLTGIKK